MWPVVREKELKVAPILYSSNSSIFLPNEVPKLMKLGLLHWGWFTKACKRRKKEEEKTSAGFL
jgi:hypothetical protein